MRTKRIARVTMVTMIAAAAALGCEARAQPLEADVIVEAAGPSAPVREGEACALRIQPAWRQGVNCQVVLRCGEEDLFGGRRGGGYAVCDYADDAFLSALDEEPRSDGDPAVDVDVRARRVTWRGPHEGESATLRIELPTRPAARW